MCADQSSWLEKTTTRCLCCLTRMMGCPSTSGVEARTDVSASWPMDSSAVFECPNRPCQEEAQFSAAVMDVCRLRRSSLMSGACSVC